MNSNSQGQVNLTTQTSSRENSSNEYSGNLFFSGHSGRNFGGNSRGGRGSDHRGGDRGRFANVQCQICYKFGHEAAYWYHRLEEVMSIPFLHQLHLPLLNLLQFKLIQLKVVRLLSKSNSLNQFSMSFAQPQSSQKVPILSSH